MRLNIWTMLACALVWFHASSVFSQEEPLPDSVSNAYLAYEQAMQRRDYQAAVEAAERAWRAAEDEEIDADLIGTLASIYGERALAVGDYAGGLEGWRSAARIGDRLNIDPLERGTRWYWASLAAFGEGDLYDTRSFAQRSMRIIDDLRSRDAAALRGEVSFLFARASAQLGRWGRVGRAADEALDAFATVGRAEDSIYADAYYLSAIDSFFWGERADAARKFQRAWNIYNQLGEARDNDRTTTRYWVQLSLGSFEGDERAALQEELVADGLIPWGERNTGEEVEAETDPNYRAPEPRLRRPPEYPRNASIAGIEGIVLVDFTVNERGRTEDVTIRASAPPGVFDDAVTYAVSRFVYDPALADGEPVSRQGMYTQFIFSLCDLPTAAACRRAAREREEEDSDETD